VCGFLGLVGYYRCFIKNYEAITELLTRLLQKAGFHWSEEATATFHVLQQALMTALVLQLPDFNRAFVVECDTSGSRVGVMLHQGSGPIAFFSRQIVARHVNLAAYECELISLVQEV
jgi:hypothetical protein